MHPGPSSGRVGGSYTGPVTFGGSSLYTIESLKANRNTFFNNN